ncbi:uncharacterized protein LOC111398358 [Olea europaea var. sylvestris]|uniref:uncharacterized protein LOC111398358 n=1 Tax=Olea europaea var. sylvestris TaxID=158386 RepID=UPI000C1CDC53|nr:uncharacterized protein LOC111398358 [Olea europaea var. sylvestris]
MNAYSGYNQIPMFRSDEEATSFITDKGLYCYKVMPFELKNVGATSQRLVNMMFAELIDKTMEALKKHLREAPLLSKPQPEKSLLLYLAVSDVTVSAVLIREENEFQFLVYYVSKTLFPTETRYLDMEKLALALITASRKLRPYFQAHSIEILTNFPLKQVL